MQQRMIYVRFISPAGIALLTTSFAGESLVGRGCYRRSISIATCGRFFPIIASIATARIQKIGRPICGLMFGRVSARSMERRRSSIPSIRPKANSLKRITSDDPDVRMPPPDSGKSLRPEQIKTLQKWVEQGAKYSRIGHLSRRSGRQVPAVKNQSLGSQSDRRVCTGAVEKEGLAPSPQAARRRTSSSVVAGFDRVTTHTRGTCRSSKRRAASKRMSSRSIACSLRPISASGGVEFGSMSLAMPIPMVSKKTSRGSCGCIAIGSSTPEPGFAVRQVRDRPNRGRSTAASNAGSDWWPPAFCGIR